MVTVMSTHCQFTRHEQINRHRSIYLGSHKTTWLVTLHLVEVFRNNCLSKSHSWQNSAVSAIMYQQVKAVCAIDTICVLQTLQPLKCPFPCS